MNAPTIDRPWVSQVQAVATMHDVKVDVGLEARLCDCTDGLHESAADAAGSPFAWSPDVASVRHLARYYAGSHPIARTTVTLRTEAVAA
ncbi:hypothetical protein N866_13570 [Actinotalea ferrariae CF5-4]|uniref:Uncharacterized protein n=1 Tax=Actinotalea ferrariae CF5-4 TaxID=948458 RepID=A0A021VSW0_9CELL|nr:hypothetical protein [Actinotalea ferrariae]EYR64274.1 hypothetical protein N866_13570 [Actinotalea ferrariae CF5-4]